MVYQRGSQREGSPHYVFLYSDDEDVSDADENIPLQPRSKTASLPRKVEVINVQLKSEDTLQALAVRYRCTISELKRINKIHKENEIHARPFIKVPVQPFSLLTETLGQAQTSQAGPDKVNEVASTKSDLLIDVSINPVVTQMPSAEINAIILNSVCEPLSSYNNSNVTELVSGDTDQLLETRSTDPAMTDIFKCSGDDCGLSWSHLLIFSLLLGFAVPVIYILYITNFSSKNHSTIDH